MRHKKSVQYPQNFESISDLEEKEIIIHSKAQVGGRLDIAQVEGGDIFLY